VKWLLISLAAITFAGLLLLAPGIPLLGAAAFGGFFQVPLLFGLPSKFAKTALRALERRKPVAATLEFDDYDTDWGVKFTLRTEAGKTWHARMAHSDHKIDALAEQRRHPVTAWLDAATGAPAAVLLGELLLWRFEVERA